MATKRSSSSSKSKISKSSGGGLKVTTNAKGVITGASDSTGSFSVSDGKATRISSGGTTSTPLTTKTTTVTKKPKTTISKITNAPGVVAGFMDGSGFDAGGKFIPAVKPDSPVTTSDPARDTYDAIKKKIGSMADSTLDYSNYLNNDNPMYGLLDDQRKALSKRRSQEISRINSEYGQAQQAQVQKQSSETGTQSMGLARIGGFDSASGQAVLTNLQRVHEGEQQALMQARQSAILQAQQAYEDKDFALAKLQIDEAKAAEAMMYNRQQDYIRNTLAIRGEERADAQMQLQQTQFEYGKQRDRQQDQRQAVDFAMKHMIKTPFYFVGGIGHDTSTGEALPYEEYIARGGDPNFQRNVTIIEPGSELERQFVIDLASKYPDAPIDILSDSVASARSKIEGSRLYQDQVRPPSSSGPSSNPINTSGELETYLVKLKQANPDIAWYDLWGQASDFLKSTKLNVNQPDYDKVFWKILHPEGETGYNNPNYVNTNPSKGDSSIR